MKRYYIIAGLILALGIPVLLLRPTMSGGSHTDFRSISGIIQIASSHYQVSIAGKHRRKIDGNTVNEWALALAKAGGSNNYKLYQAGRGQPSSISEESIYNDIKKLANEEFLLATIPYDIAPGQYTDENDISHIPLIWTTGLKPDGTWSKESPWEGEGGHVAYVCGNAVWFKGRAEFKKYGTEEITHDVSEALPPNTKILRANKPVDLTDYNSDAHGKVVSNLIISHP